MMRRMLSLLLCAAMVVSIFPVQAFAMEDVTEPAEPVQETEATVETTVPAEATTVPTEAVETEPAAEEFSEDSAQEETVPTEAAEPEEEEKPVWQEGEVSGIPDLDSTEQLLGYLNPMYQDGTLSVFGTLARERLSEADKILYDGMKEQLVRIAAGQERSIEFYIDFRNTGCSGWDTDPELVMDALAHDCPFELYWFSEWWWKDQEDDYVYIALNPNAYYQPEQFDINEYPYINTEKTARAAAAANSISSIITRYESYNDYNKLSAYADEICRLVEYDYDAAYGNTYGKNINPWTLIHVFDGDPSTNVVCEGYSEAFQYLCDMSVFKEDVECYSASGNDHKWNIIRYNGVSYLMDVTHCDYGDTAYRGPKFFGGGQGSIADGYWIGDFHYWYYDYVTELWGTGEDSILKLTETGYAPDMTQAEFEAALKNCGGRYDLTRPIQLDRDLDLDGIYLVVRGDGMLTIPSGVTLKMSETSSLWIYNGGQVIVESGANLISMGNLADNDKGIVGYGDVLSIYWYEDYGQLIVSGRGTIEDGDLDFAANATYLSVEGGIKKIGARAFDGFANLDYIDLDSSKVTEIGEKAFSGCRNIESISIPKNVTRLGDYAFSGCSNVFMITFRGSLPVFEGTARCFEGITATVQYPRGDATWTNDALQNYGGDLTWEAQCVNGHQEVILPGTAPTCKDAGISEGAYCALCNEIMKAQVILRPVDTHTYSDDADNTCNICGQPRTDEVFPFSEQEWDFLKRINRERLDNGVSPLTGFARLQKAGDLRAEELQEKPSSIRPDGSYGETVLEEFGINTSWNRELITIDYETAESVLELLMSVQYYQSLLLDDYYSHLGIGEQNGRWSNIFIDGGGYTSIRLVDGEMLIVEPGTRLEDLELVAILESNGRECYLPVESDYYQGYDPAITEDQQVTLSVLGVSTSFTVHSHRWTEATCSAPRTCHGCGETDGEPLGHHEVIDAAVAGTCTTAGMTEGKHCDVCGETLVQQEQIPAPGHQWKDADAEIRLCLRCGEVEGGYRIDIDTDEDAVWIDDVIYPVGRDDHGSYVLIKNSDASVVSVYTWHLGDDYEVYPIGMQVWTLQFENGSYTATYVPEFEDLLQYSGMSIRVTGKKGIRMITSLEQSKKNALTGDGLAGYTLKEYGTVVAWADQLGNEALILGTPCAKSSYAYKKGVADPVFAVDGDSMQYTNVLVGFSNAQCGKDLVMRPYMILTDGEEDITLYGGTVERSIGCIALQNKNTFEPNTDAYEYIWDIIHYVYGDAYDGEYQRD